MVLILAIFTVMKERRREEEETWEKRREKKNRQSRKKRKKKMPQGMTESCEWRGQIWLFLGATGTVVCRVAWISCTAGVFQFVRSV